MRQYDNVSLGSFFSQAKQWLSFIGRIPALLLIIWLFAVWRGEHGGFSKNVQSCSWNKWETWSNGNRPHRILLVADPQIVDPHTYPGRPWPLSSLTVIYTDLYMKRAYRQLLRKLQPDSTIFLGDLFDGGREWGTERYKSPDPQYRKYGQDFWLQEYQRFENMFVDTWYQEGIPHLSSSYGRRLIASVPGNHDLGFGSGINPDVKGRFDAHFGPLNRVDILGNHTIISLDTVSLSAMDQVDPLTGATGTGDGSGGSSSSANIWRPVKEYIQDIKGYRDNALRHELQIQSSFDNSEKYSTAPRSGQEHSHVVEDADREPTADHGAKRIKVTSQQFPTIVLSHVPFYRSEDTNCGPSRERGTSIPISAGYQYQNVLTPLISKDVVDSLDASQIAMIYSGDDHDYCEIEHDRFTGRIKEITVKSISWAMGVRHPGVQLISLWNPVDISSNGIEAASNTGTPRNTVQNHLCLLPDQLAIFIHYGELLLLTIVMLVVRAIFWKHSQSESTTRFDDDQLLPVSNPSHGNYAMASSTPNGYVSSRKSVNGHATQRIVQDTYTKFEADSDDWGMPTTDKDKTAYTFGLRHIAWSRRILTMGPRTKMQAFMYSLVTVTGPVLSVYAWFMWHDM